MAAYNHVTFIGNLVRNPETRVINGANGQTQLTKFSIAVDHKTKRVDETMFIDVVAWDGLAEIAEKFLEKGKSVLVAGRLSIRPYKTKEGENRKSVEVIASDIKFLSSRPSTAASAGAGDNEPYEDEVPF
jgi:single-strand DNA-binding protein